MKNFIKLFCLLLAISCMSALAVFAVSAEAVELPENYGDVDGNSDTNIDDAFHLLYNRIFGDDDYGLNGPADFNGDGIIDIDDVIYLLSNLIHGSEEYPLLVHEHKWEDKEIVTAADCVTAGTKTVICSCGKEETRPYGPNGHTWDKDSATCTEGRTCSVCNATEPAKGHDYAEKNRIAASCTEGVKVTYKCNSCADEYTETVGSPLGHNIEGVVAEDVLVQGTTCDYIQQYTCLICSATVNGEVIQHHTYVASVTKEATCVASGEKTITCSKCQNTYYETIAIDTEAGHAWDEGTLEGNVKTYTCKNACGETKSVVDASASNNATVEADDLQSAKEVELSNAAIGLDNATLDQVKDKTISLEVNTIEGADRNDINGLTTEKMEQLGDNPVYNFIMKEGETPITNFDGKVTVTLPYTLTEGEDVDSIAVWYINAEGVLEKVEATYSNGSVTFVTDHFSYYTVTRLTPAERCELYGHNEKPVTTSATCTEVGNTTYVCIRCGHKRLDGDSIVAALGHNYSENITPATCLKDGAAVFTCTNENCNHTYTNKLPKLTHDWKVETEEAATCEKPGYKNYECGRVDCTETYQEKIETLGHDYNHVVKAPTCTEGGQTTSTCKLCNYSYTHTPTAATGHRAVVDKAVAATCTTPGKTEGSHCELCGLTVKKQNDIPASHKVTVVETAAKAPTCTEAGNTESRRCTVCNEIAVASEVIPAIGHVEEVIPAVASTCTKAGSAAGKKCSVCGEITLKPAELAVSAHSYVKVEAKAATCTENGNIEYSYCSVCNYAVNAEGVEIEAASAVITASHVLVKIDAKAPTCTEAGNNEYSRCTACLVYAVNTKGEVTSPKLEILPAAHSMVEVIAKAPSCKEDGNVAYEYCKNCDYMITSTGLLANKDDVILPAFHVLASVEAKAPTCTKAGNIFYTYCKNCDHVVNAEGIKIELSATVVPAAGHALVGVAAKAPTCTEGGNLAYSYCTNCDWFQGSDGAQTNLAAVVLPATGHNYVNNICSYCGADSGNCEHENCVYSNFKLNGSDCVSGYTYTKTCRDCSAVMSGSELIDADHRLYLISSKDLEDIGACDGSIDQYSCACGYTKDAAINIGCKFGEVVDTLEKNEEGIECTVSRTTCTECGLALTEWMYKTADEAACLATNVSNITLTVGETSVEAEIIIHSPNHRYIYTDLVLNGKTCADGYTYNRECMICQDSGSGVVESDTEHIKYLIRYIDLKPLDICGEYILEYKCACGHIDDIKFNNPCDTTIAKTTYKDEAGNTHTVNTYTCSVCDLIRVRDSYSVKNLCTTTNYYHNTYTIDGKDYIFTEHTYKYNHPVWVCSDFVLDGETCQDGYSYTRTCPTCGMSEKLTGKSNHTKYCVEYLDLTALGACGNYVRQNSCACGASKTITTSNACTTTSKSSTYTDENGDLHKVTTYTCSTCGLVREQDVYDTVKDAECKYIGRRTYTYMFNGKSYRFTYYSDLTSHNLVYGNFVLSGKTCAEAFTYTSTCLDCGKVSNLNSKGETDHRMFRISYVDLADIGACGGYVYQNACACGAEIYAYWSDKCTTTKVNSSYKDDAGLSHSVITYTCSKCGLVRAQDGWNENPAADCTYDRHVTYTYTMGDKQIAKVERLFHNASHNYIYTFKLKGTSCAEGYTAIATCTKCGGTDTQEITDDTEHRIWRIEKRYEFKEMGACGGYAEQRGCACGLYKTLIFSLNCKKRTTVDSSYEQDGVFHNVYTETCPTCGFAWTTDHTESAKNDKCEFTYTFKYTAKLGEVTKTYEDIGTEYMHNYIFSDFVLTGTTCEDAYTYKGKCRDCGVVDSFKNSGNKKHNTYCISYIDLKTLGACGGYAEQFVCACGYRKSVYNHLECSMETVKSTYKDKDGNLHTVWTDTCTVCGFTMAEDRYDGAKNEKCEYQIHIEYTYGNNPVKHEFIDTLIDHSHIFTFVLNGKTCEEGYSYTGACITCGDTYTKSFDTDPDHRVWAVEIIDLKELGACGGTIERESCACGYSTGLWNNSNCVYKWKSSEYTDEAGNYHDVRTYTCSDCGLVRVRDIYSVNDTACRMIEYIKETYTLGENTKTITASRVYTNHKFAYSNFILKGETCADGYSATATCVYCGYSESQSFSGNNHARRLVEYIDLTALGACGDYIEKTVCACGYSERVYLSNNCEYKRTNRYYIDEAGYEHRESTYTCTKCALVRVEDSYSTEIVNCKYDYLVTHTVTFGDTTKTISAVEKRENHRYVYSNFVLAGEACVGEVTCTVTCINCGNSEKERWSIDEHNLFDVEYVDLKQQGACGGYIIKRSCPCGKNTGISWDLQCESMDYNYEKKEIDGVIHEFDTYNCAKCGLVWVRDYWNGEKDANCSYTRYRNDTFKIGDVNLQGSDSWINENNHDNAIDSFILNGTDCTDGYSYITKCRDCGITETITNDGSEGHATYVVEEVDLADLGSCGGEARKIVCACGQQANIVIFNNSCRFTYNNTQQKDDNGIVHYIETSTCSVCGFVVTRDMTNTEPNDKCEFIENITYTYQGSKGLSSLTVSGKNYSHDYLYSNFVLNGKTCKEGYTASRTCRNCGETSSVSGENHVEYPVRVIDLKVLGACAGTIEQFSCPCGQEKYLSRNIACQETTSDYNTYTDDQGVFHRKWTDTCTKCGLVMVLDRYDGEKDANCRYQRHDVYTYTIGGKSETVESNHTYTNHEYVYTYTLTGTTCEEGYTSIGTCVCGEYVTETRESDADHIIRTTGYYDLKNLGACGGYVREYSCACGKTQGYDIELNCNTTSVGHWDTDENGFERRTVTKTCSKCSLVYTLLETYGERNENCERPITVKCTFACGDKSYAFDFVRTDTQHEFVYGSFVLNNGVDCLGGYTGVGTCVDCNATEPISVENGGHSYWRIEYVDLKALGACGGYLEIGSCACGETPSFGWDTMCNDPTWEYTNYDGTDGFRHNVATSTCSKCGLVYEEDSYETEKDAQCKRDRYATYTVTLNGNTRTFESESNYGDHEYTYGKFVLNGQTCTEGYTYEGVCRDCGYTRSYTRSEGDCSNTFIVEYTDLKELGACGGYIERRSCACGSNGWLNYHHNECNFSHSFNQYTDNDGYDHDVYIRTCKKCGLKIQDDNYNILDSANCRAISYHKVVVSNGNSAISYDYAQYVDNHNFTVIAELVPGGSSCEDGWTATYTCACGEIRTESGSHHYVIIKSESIDLAEYGSVCGGKLNIMTCPCGQKKQEIIDVNCDMDIDYSDEYNWMGIDNTYLEISLYGGYRRFTQPGEKHTCAVTDPAQCGLVLYRLPYWVKSENSCEYYAHVAWKFGDGEDARVFDYATGEVDYYHTLVEENIDTTEGEYTVIGTKRICACGTYLESKAYYNSNGNLVKNVETAVIACVEEQIARNFKGFTLINDYNAEGYVVKNEFVRETYDGSEYNRTYTYTYTNESCTRTVTRTGTDYSEPEVSVEEHYSTTPWKTIVYSTCSQPGLRAIKCAICDAIVESEEILPGHKWALVEEGLYSCKVCGLENTNGADGSIVMEDLTASLGGTDYYVVGYYAKNDIKFTHYVSLALKTPLENGNDEVILEGIAVESLTGDIGGIRFSREAVAAAATAAGYTADQYDVRFTFVPEAADGNFDYAITLTAETASAAE